MFVGVGVGVIVGVLVGGEVGVIVGVSVGVSVNVDGVEVYGVGVGVSVGVGVGAHTATLFVSNVTAQFSASALPDMLALVFRVMSWSARIFPLKTEFVPSVAEVPTCQYTLQS